MILGGFGNLTQHLDPGFLFHSYTKVLQSKEINDITVLLTLYKNVIGSFRFSLPYDLLELSCSLPHIRNREDRKPRVGTRRAGNRSGKIKLSDSNTGDAILSSFMLHMAPTNDLFLDICGKLIGPSFFNRCSDGLGFGSCFILSGIPGSFK
jgi:hypothetical protein